MSQAQVGLHNHLIVVKLASLCFPAVTLIFDLLIPKANQYIYERNGFYEVFISYTEIKRVTRILWHDVIVT